MSPRSGGTIWIAQPVPQSAERLSGAHHGWCNSAAAAPVAWAAGSASRHGAGGQITRLDLDAELHIGPISIAAKYKLQAHSETKSMGVTSERIGS